MLALLPGATYDDYLTVTFTSSDFLEVNRAFISMQMCAGTSLGQIARARIVCVCGAMILSSLQPSSIYGFVRARNG
jgi:hypothetical protein